MLRYKKTRMKSQIIEVFQKEKIKDVGRKRIPIDNGWGVCRIRESHEPQIQNS